MTLRGKLALRSDKKVPFANADLSLIDDQQQIVQAATTDQNGKFVFNYLPLDTTLYLVIDEQAIATLPKGTTILLMDENDSIINKTTATTSKFLLTNLPSEENTLSKIYIEDPWMQATLGNFKEEMLVIENIYFDYAKWNITPQAKAVLNKVVIVLKNNLQISLEISAHTDSRGSTESNLILSEKRAEEAKKYIISQGIDPKRIVAKGFGESRLLNRCKDGVDCTEEEHAKNRRMEFKLKKKSVR
jgi:outer membrane protein OmpA-like peptidoglycan-associated protein